MEVHPVPDRPFEFLEAEETSIYLAKRGHMGKVVVKVAYFKHFSSFINRQACFSYTEINIYSL
jgi:hypothetical protein